MKVWGNLIILCLILAGSKRLLGQTCCSGGTPLLGNLGIQSIDANSFCVQFAYDYNYLDDLYSGNQLLNDNSRERLTQTALIQVIYPFSEKLSVNSLLTYVSQERIIHTSSGTKNQTNSNGLGDAVLMLQYAPFSNLKRGLTFAGGLKLPIGKFDATDDEFGLVLSPDLQPGSGSFDFILGTTYQESHIFDVIGFSASSSMSLRFTTPAERFDGDNEYTFGNEIMFSVGLLKNILLKKVGFTPSLFARFRNTKADKIDDFEVEGTGGNWIYLSPGFNLELNNNFSVNALADLPVYRNLNGTQLTTTYRFNVGLAIKIFKQ